MLIMIHQSRSPYNYQIALKALSPNVRSLSFQDEALHSSDPHNSDTRYHLCPKEIPGI